MSRELSCSEYGPVESSARSDSENRTLTPDDVCSQCLAGGSVSFHIVELHHHAI